ncbi:MAG: cupin domain-containing protein [Chloroflexi bacterium]|nr:cupin domain-containing protein [Chloroflexota bacterium]
MEQRRPIVNLAGYQPGRSVVRKDEVRLRPSPTYQGLYEGTIIGPETGCFCTTMSLDLHHIPPGSHTGTYRHDDMLLHVLSGKGHSVIDDVRYEWERGDTIHIKPGVWFQHFNPSAEPVNMLAARATPLLNSAKPCGPIVTVGAGDYVELEDTEYEHPFGLGKEKPGGSREKGHGLFDEWRAQRKAYLENEMRKGRVIMKARDVHWEYGAHRGELNAMLAYPGLGFDVRMLFHVGLQAIAPGGSNETHIHMEAIVYILSGKGTVIVKGVETGIEQGDCCFVHWGEPHQFRASPDSAKLFIQMRIHLKEFLDWQFPFPFFEERKETGLRGPAANYIARPPW